MRLRPMCLFSPCDFPVFDGQNARALFEQLREAAGRSVANHLGDLAHGAAEAPLEADFSFAHSFLCMMRFS